MPDTLVAPRAFDALLPPEMARRAEDVGVTKAALDTPVTLVLAVLAGAFIALGAVFATVAAAGARGAPWGATRVLVVVGGAELFTGNTLIVMAWAGGRALLVCLAVWLTYSARTTTDRILALVPPVAAFVAAGFEHSVANMYFVPYALLLAAVDPGFLAAHGLDAASLTWTRFLVRNLAPVTLGNVIGGTALVGGVYWFVYLRRRPAAVVTEAPAPRRAGAAPRQ